MKKETNNVLTQVQEIFKFKQASKQASKGKGASYYLTCPQKNCEVAVD